MDARAWKRRLRQWNISREIKKSNKAFVMQAKLFPDKESDDSSKKYQD